MAVRAATINHPYIRVSHPVAVAAGPRPQGPDATGADLANPCLDACCVPWQTRLRGRPRAKPSARNTSSDGLLALAGRVPRSITGRRHDRRLVRHVRGVGCGHAVVDLQDEVLGAIGAVLRDVVVL